MYIKVRGKIRLSTAPIFIFIFSTWTLRKYSCWEMVKTSSCMIGGKMFPHETGKITEKFYEHCQHQVGFKIKYIALGDHLLKHEFLNQEDFHQNRSLS